MYRDDEDYKAVIAKLKQLTGHDVKDASQPLQSNVTHTAEKINIFLHDLLDGMERRIEAERKTADQWRTQYEMCESYYNDEGYS